MTLRLRARLLHAASPHTVRSKKQMAIRQRLFTYWKQRAWAAVRAGVRRDWRRVGADRWSWWRSKTSRAPIHR